MPVPIIVLLLHVTRTLLFDYQASCCKLVCALAYTLAADVHCEVQVCFKCGQKGHWAADCKTDLPTGQKETVNMAWCVTDTALLDAEAAPLPTFLRTDAVAILAAHGAISSAYTSQGNLDSAVTLAHALIPENPARQGRNKQSGKTSSDRQNAGHDADLDSGSLNDCFRSAEVQAGSDSPRASSPREQVPQVSTCRSDVHAVYSCPAASTSQKLQQAAPLAEAGSSLCVLGPPAAQAQSDVPLDVGGGDQHGKGVGTSVGDTLRAVLRDAFGFEDFRSFQLPVICKLLQV
jgi:hypothetical protein